MITLYGLKNCDTCRKAMKSLEGAGRQVEFHDVKKEPLSHALLADFLKTFGADKLVNKKSTTWRGLNEAERSRDPLELLIENPSLMKRPVIIDGENEYLGWDRAVQSTLIG
ncbi:arsenate reductase family protein [Maritalea mediterranea]|uniref:Arsenate reductase n=1 Tax=Maritalea mediterranea TaxID=2909667 RepID=A0ABS9E8F3_9HYPH|nr:ArsC/Spx/MgsR family protein [Maritalea mediterranea]MCF4099147.1 arsenate reductase [Maritalea mediterranea]